MKITIEHHGANYQLDLASGRSIAIKQRFDTKQPNHFGAQQAQKQPMQSGSFIGDTKQGGSCNVLEVQLNPHCNGTHTETVGHICHLDDEATKTIADLSVLPLLPCALISVTPTHGQATCEDYVLAFEPEDFVITQSAIAEALGEVESDKPSALVIRTLPNSTNKRQASYNAQHANAFLTTQAMAYLAQLEVEHLIVDIPSIDRLNDQGLLANHHLYWQVTPQARHVSNHQASQKTITELAFIDDQLSDGFYFLNLQLPAWLTDAAPSQPVLYRPCQKSPSQGVVHD